jgi:glyoxylase-like metal-dependent hydrolase (beta-lactamase superfamily II)
MAVDIFQIDLGFDQCYILKSEGVIAVDAGAPNKGKIFANGLERVSIHPQDVQLVVITHGHWDHVGSAGELKAITGAKLAMHQREVHWLEQSLAPLPPGITLWGRIFISIHKKFLPLIKIPPAEVDVTLGDEGLSLYDYGIPGRVLHTPGHSSGSVSVLLDTGEAFVGDLAMNKFPLRLSPGLPIFAEDPAEVVRSWKLLLDHGASRVYPAHGKPFAAAVIEKAISRAA